MIALLAFLVALGVLITIHEYGHYRVARACGVKVLRFSVGFGRVLLRWQPQPDGTEFVVCALPLGGYVRMLDGREAPVPAAQRAQAFDSQSVWRRMAIVLAGPLANLLLAVALFAGVHWIGMDEPKALLSTPPADSVAQRAGVRSGDWVRESSPDGVDWSPVMSMADLHWRVVQALMQSGPLHLRVTDMAGHGERTLRLDTQALENREPDAAAMRRLGLGVWRDAVVHALPDGPAARAGVQAGDRVLRVDEDPVRDAAHLESLIRAHVADGRPQPMAWHIARGAQSLTLTFEPALDPKDGVARAAVRLGGPAETVTVQRGFADGLQEAVRNTWDRSLMTLQMLGSMLVGQASVKNLSGALSMADYAGQAASMGLAAYLAYLAALSVGLGVLNLLPVPVLDGGHLMYYLFEAATGRPVSGPWLERLQRGGMVVLLLTMSLALFNDVTRLLGQH